MEAVDRGDEVEIRIRDLTLTYTGKRRVEALSDINLDIHRDGLTAIIGPSGCGKSTLLKALNRLTDIIPGIQIHGEVVIDGHDIYHPDRPVPELRKRVGYVPQKPTALPMTVFENVAYGLRLHGKYGKKELGALVQRYLEKVNLWDEVCDRLDQPAADLSVGQIQRLCLARSLAVEPAVLLCDEVTSALDPVSAQSVEDTLLALKRDYTIVMVTHMLEQARRLADHVVFLYLGAVIEIGSAESFFAQPKHELTRAFVAGRKTVGLGGGERQ